MMTTRTRRWSSSTYPSADDSDDDAYDGRTLQYTTLPLGVVIMKGYVITISLYENLNIEDMAHGVVRGGAHGHEERVSCCCSCCASLSVS